MKRLFSISLFLACIMMLQARNYLVCVGIADYPGTEGDLSLSDHDAISIQRLYEKNNDAYVISFINEQATKDNITAAIVNTFNKASEQDAIVFYFSGHGMPGCFICYDGILRYDRLTTVMAESHAKCKLIFADACFSGRVREDTPETMDTIENTVLFFLSSRSGEASIERAWGWRNSLFTAYLERGLRGGADTNSDRIITARELFQFVNTGVVNDSQKQQHPVMWGRFSDDMPIMSWKEGN